jgi:transposase
VARHIRCRSFLTTLLSSSGSFSFLLIAFITATYFTSPLSEWQHRYEALRASFVERLPAPIVAKRFGYSPEYVRLLRHFFVHGKIDFSEPVPEGKAARRGVTADVRQKNRSWREQQISAGEMAELLSKEGIEISIRTVERVLAEEGVTNSPHRSRGSEGFRGNPRQPRQIKGSVSLGGRCPIRFGHDVLAGSRRATLSTAVAGSKRLQQSEYDVSSQPSSWSIRRRIGRRRYS